MRRNIKAAIILNILLIIITILSKFIDGSIQNINLSFIILLIIEIIILIFAIKIKKEFDEFRMDGAALLLASSVMNLLFCLFGIISIFSLLFSVLSLAKIKEERKRLEDKINRE